MAKTALSPLRKYRGKVILAPLLKIIECMAELATPFLVRYVIDDGIASHDMKAIFILGGIIVALAVVGFGSTMVAQYLASRVASDYGHDLRSLLFAHSLALDERSLEKASKAKVSTYIGNDAFAMQNGVMMFMRLIFRPPILLLGSFCLSFVVSPWAGLIFGVAIVLSAAVMGTVMLLSPKRYRAIQSRLDDLSTISSDDIQGRRQIKAFNNQELEKRRYLEAAKRYESASMEMGKLSSFVNPLTFLFINAGIVLVVFLGGNYEGLGGLTSGEIASLISYLVSSLAALTMWSRLVSSLNKALESKRRLDAYLALEEKGEGKKDKAPALLAVRFDNVGFTYGQKGDGKAVSGLSFELREGKSIGVVGGTGSGKSTVAKLLSGVYAPSEGTVFLNGQIASQNGEKKLDLRSFFAYVPQKTILFSGTVRSNLLLGRPTASDDELIEALKKAQALAFLKEKGSPLDVAVSEGGSNFSGGQRQRIVLARASLSSAPALILDDSLSALDYITEKKIRDELPSLFKTAFLVSSRLSLVEKCDEILFFDHGEIAARGSHEELLNRSPAYREFYEIQKGAIE